MCRKSEVCGTSITEVNCYHLSHLTGDSLEPLSFYPMTLLNKNCTCKDITKVGYTLIEGQSDVIGTPRCFYDPCFHLTDGIFN